MSQRIRNAFLSLGAICILAMISGLTVHAHLAHVDEPAEHDGAHCSLCQQLAISRQAYTANLECANVEIALVERLASAYPIRRFQQTLPSQSHPRAPPA
ncbi:MAG: hypothetical protein JSW27_15115 [Phycisphaerales bacterium]|nr:MAG: hypothetical protein JSW27_15115 [Phycisphaerales bacterium]